MKPRTDSYPGGQEKAADRCCRAAMMISIADTGYHMVPVSGFASFGRKCKKVRST